MDDIKKEEPITIQNVTDWKLGVAGDSIKRRIEEDLKQPDSEVMEFLEWAGGVPERRNSRIASRSLKETVKTAGGWRAFAEDVIKTMKEVELNPDYQKRGR